MLVFPILSQDDGDLMGVVQVINTLSGLPFPAMAEEGAPELAKTLAIALSQRQAPVGLVKTKFDALVSAGIISTPELALAQRLDLKRRKDTEEVRIDPSQGKPATLRKSTPAFITRPWNPSRSEDRKRSV